MQGIAEVHSSHSQRPLNTPVLAFRVPVTRVWNLKASGLLVSDPFLDHLHLYPRKVTA